MCWRNIETKICWTCGVNREQELPSEICGLNGSEFCGYEQIRRIERRLSLAEHTCWQPRNEPRAAGGLLELPPLISTSPQSRNNNEAEWEARASNVPADLEHWGYNTEPETRDATYSAPVGSSSVAPPAQWSLPERTGHAPPPSLSSAGSALLAETMQDRRTQQQMAPIRTSSKRGERNDRRGGSGRDHVGDRDAQDGPRRYGSSG